MVGIMSFLYEPHVHEELRLNLNDTFIENYKMDDSKTRAIDRMQIEVAIWDRHTDSIWYEGKVVPGCFLTEHHDMKTHSGNGGTAPRIIWPRHSMDANGQLHAPAALPPGKEPLVPIITGKM